MAKITREKRGKKNPRIELELIGFCSRKLTIITVYLGKLLFATIFLYPLKVNSRSLHQTISLV